MYADQFGRCAICGGVNDIDRRLSVDHNHDTGEVRGLLCNRCNRAIGLLGDSIDILESAISYLSTGRKKKR